ncbi:MAG TPA: peptidoglycan-binding protein [Acidimicrobiales bacterium]|nr:peptidoglycan-binding protein [Acidimicrobiales bacterium]
MSDLPIDRERPEPGSEGVPRDQDPNPPVDIPFAPGGPVGTATAVLDFFVRNDGLGEDPDGSNHNWITEWYGVTGPWCAMTVSRALLEGGFSRDGETVEVPGLEQTTNKGWAYVPYVRTNFEDAGRFHESGPQLGDLVIFDWEMDGDGDHIGVFQEDLGDGTCLCREGNTSNNLLELKRRPYSLIAGFCRPPYGDNGATPTEPTFTGEPGEVPPFPGLTQLGSSGEIVRQVQQRLADRGWNIAVTGEFDAETDRIVRSFQTNKNLEVDGKVGPITWSTMWTSPIT